MEKKRRFNSLVLVAGISVLLSCNQGINLNSVAKVETTADTLSYCIGMDIASSFLREQWDTLLNNELVYKGINDVLKNQQKPIPKEVAKVIISQYIERQHIHLLAQRYAENRNEGEKYLAENAKKKGVVSLDNGVQYRVLTEGNGEIPSDKDKVKLHYIGKRINGKEFVDTHVRKKPFVALIGGNLVKGLSEALKHMPVGSKWEIVVPQELAYGVNLKGTKNIEPYSTLVFEVELLSLERTKRPLKSNTEETKN